jgi:hypothetical protein
MQGRSQDFRLGGGRDWSGQTFIIEKKILEGTRYIKF